MRPRDPRKESGGIRGDSLAMQLDLARPCFHALRRKARPGMRCRRRRSSFARLEEAFEGAGFASQRLEWAFAHGARGDGSAVRGIDVITQRSGRVVHTPKLC